MHNIGKQGRKLITLRKQTTAPRKGVLELELHIQIINQALAFHTAGDLNKALAAYDKAIAIKPDHALTHSCRGFALQQLGNHDEALAAYSRAITISPDYAEAHYNRGVALQELGRLEEALTAWNQAIVIKPDYISAHFNIGIALQKFGRYDEALTAFDKTITLSHTYAEAHFNRGYVLEKLGRYEDAILAYDQAIIIKPDYADAHLNRGVALQALQKFEEAIFAYDQAIIIKPDFASACYNKSLLLLLRGEYEDGWRLYEWRNEVEKRFARHFEKPLLCTENKDLRGKTALLYSEQGLGDTIQMLRYVPLLAKHGMKIIMDGPASLHSLVRELPGVAGTVGRGEVLPDFDLQCSLMSLPLAFKTKVETIPNAVPYLKTPNSKVTLWKDRLGIKTRPRIGLVWSGGTAHFKDRERSIPLAMLLPLLDKNAEFHSIQKEYRDTDKELLAIHEDRLRDHSKEIVDFGDTAAIIEEMDLVISVDTAVAHLAGALGKPVWILLPYEPDFRWLINREDSPWYPTARLFRQSSVHDWKSVIATVKSALLEQIC